jgi:hypothetical protein
MQQWHGTAVFTPNGCAAHAASLSLQYTTSNPPPTTNCSSGSAPPTLALFTTRLDGTITAPHAGSWEFRVVTNGAVRLWVDDHIIVDSSCDSPIAPPDGRAKLPQPPLADHPRTGPVCK